jgi:cobalt-zinc-cadmium efflux system protein
MKSEKKILFAFLLNLAFSVFEFVGGIITGSVAILSDAIHDIGDAGSLGISYFLEKKSKEKENESYTYGYGRYSVLGALITNLILLAGSVIVVFNAVDRILRPVEMNYNGIIIFAVVGVIVNFLAARLTHDGHSLNQKAVNLHMIEDVLGWLVVLVGAVIMRVTDWAIIDPLMSIAVAIFILVHVVKNLKEVFEIFLEKIPNGITVEEIQEHISEIEGVLHVHHIHIWSMDGYHSYASMCVVSDENPQVIKEHVKEELYEHGISYVTIEIESSREFEQTKAHHKGHCCQHHHHHHHHHH